MRIIKVDDYEFEIRPLKRGFIREMRKKGMSLENLTLSLSEKAMDLVLEKALSPDDYARTEELDNPACIRLFHGALRETFSAPDEEKNLSTSPGGSKTPSDEVIATPAPAEEIAPVVSGNAPLSSTPQT